MPNHSQVAHLWANQVPKQRGRNKGELSSQTPRSRGSNMYFEGPAIYSYGSHFCIARHVANKKGQKAVLFTKRDYSNTTAKHKGEVRHSLRGLDVPVFYVPQVDRCGSSYFSDWALEDFSTPEGLAFLDEAFDSFLDEAAELVEKAKCSKAHGSWNIDRAKNLREDARELRDFFGLKRRIPTELGVGITAGLVKECKAKRKLWEAESAKRYEAKRARWAAQAFEKFLAGTGDYCPWQFREDPRGIIRRAELDAITRQGELATFRAWQAGEAVRCPYSYQEDGNGSAYLRVKLHNHAATCTANDTEQRTCQRGDVVQTSRGAEVPFEDARKAFRFVKLCRLTGRAFKANGTQVPVGGFELRSIAENGDVRVGCHFFTWQRVEEFAKAAGIFEDPASPEALKGTKSHV